MEDALESEKLFKLSNHNYLYLERNIPTGWLYTLYNKRLQAITGGDIDLFYITSWKAGQIALKKMGMQELEMSEYKISLQQLLS